MIYAVYAIKDGALVSVTDDAKKLAPAEVLQAKGYAVAMLEISNFDAGGAWDPVALGFLPRELIVEDPNADIVTVSATPSPTQISAGALALGSYDARLETADQAATRIYDAMVNA